MTFDPHSLFAYSTVKSIVSQTSTTYVIKVQTNDGQRFAVGQQVVLCPSTSQPTYANAMIARVTAISGDQLTIDYSSANRESSNTRIVRIGDQIANIITPKIFTDIENEVNKTLAYAIAL